MQDQDRQTAGAGAGSGVSDLADELGSWMAASGYARKTVSKAKGALRALSATWSGMPLSNFDAMAAMEGFADAWSALPNWQQGDAKSLPRLLCALDYDRVSMASERSFHYYHVNPGASSLGFGAEKAGGRPVGATHVSRKARPGYIAYHGDNSIDDDPTEGFDIVLVDLPFSVFVGHGPGDPEIAAVLKAASPYIRRAKGALFRVDWSAGERLGLDPLVWTRLLATVLPGYDTAHIVLQNTHFVPMEGAELFMAAAKSLETDFKPVLSGIEPIQAKSVLTDAPHTGWALAPVGISARRFPREKADRFDSHYPHAPHAAVVGSGKDARMLFPLEIMAILGFPERFPVPRDRFDAYHILGDSVAVPVAERAVRGLLRSVGMD